MESPSIENNRSEEIPTSCSPPLKPAPIDYNLLGAKPKTKKLQSVLLPLTSPSNSLSSGSDNCADDGPPPLLSPGGGHQVAPLSSSTLTNSNTSEEDGDREDPYEENEECSSVELFTADSNETDAYVLRKNTNNSPRSFDNGLVAACNFCGLRWAYDLLDSHELACQIRFKEKCSFCFEMIAKEWLESHKKMCRERSVFCPLCREEIHIVAVDSHEKVCSRFYENRTDDSWIEQRRLQAVANIPDFKSNELSGFGGFPDAAIEKPENVNSATKALDKNPDVNASNLWQNLDPLLKNAEKIDNSETVADVSRFNDHCMYCSKKIPENEDLKRHEASCSDNPVAKKFVYCDIPPSGSHFLKPCQFCRVFIEPDKLAEHMKSCLDDPAISGNLNAWQKLWLPESAQKELLSKTESESYCEEFGWDDETENYGKMDQAAASDSLFNSYSMFQFGSRFPDTPGDIPPELHDVKLPCEFCFNHFKTIDLFQHQRTCRDNPQTANASSSKS